MSLQIRHFFLNFVKHNKPIEVHTVEHTSLFSSGQGTITLEIEFSKLQFVLKMIIFLV